MSDDGWILITGASKNLGAYLAKKLAQDNHPVLVHYNKSKMSAFSLVDELVKEKKQAKAVFGDFSSKQGLEKFVEKIQDEPIKSIIHNVGNYLEKSFLETSENDFDQLLQTNMKAPFVITKALVPTLKRNKGSLIFLGVAGLEKLRAETTASMYTMTKQMLGFYMKTLAKELARFHVRSNMISPGYLEHSVVQPKGDLPMRRSGTYEDIYNVVQFLLNPANNYVTGQDIEVAGAVRL
ncbi:MAG: SDR family oxidoreductase [Chlamydiota bacterium]|jgi:NAD(P)-dependent dehydrogenase (short-subunit alcohol dehydrogenase family)